MKNVGLNTGATIALKAYKVDNTEFKEHVGKDISYRNEFKKKKLLRCIGDDDKC